jgi:DNA-binding transcriptional LysR family regulator
MDLVQLEHFLAVVAERTFTRAAERVSRTQPAVSQSIKRLEDAIGTPLFARDAHDVTLTEAGRLLATHARRMVAIRDDALRQLAQLATLKAGTLAIAAHESAAVYLLPAALRDYVSQFPGIKVALYRNPVSEIPRQVMDREVDIGFVREAPAFRELRLTEVHVDQMVLIVAPDHPLTSRTNVTIHDLAGEPFVRHSQCDATARTMHRVSEKYGVKLRVAAELWSFENIKGFVREGVGLGIVPLVTVREDLRAGTLARIGMPPLEIPRRTLMIHREQGYLSECASELIKMLQTFNWGALPPARRPTQAAARRAGRSTASRAASRRRARAR